MLMLILELVAGVEWVVDLEWAEVWEEVEDRVEREIRHGRVS